MDVVALDAGAVIERILSRAKYDAVYFNADTTDTDPAQQPRLLVQLRQRALLEHRAEDAGDGVGAADRRADGAADRVARRGGAQALFDEVQKIFAEHLPMVYFVAPRIFVAASRARDQRDAGRVAPAAAVVAGHGRGRAS